MPIDMKETIARETIKLLFEKHIKKLTVKDIVEACNITRQAFYYHFSDIPELFQWIVERGKDQFLSDFLKSDDNEEQIRHLLLYAAHVRPVIKRGLSSSYSDELENILWKNMQEIFRCAAEQKGYLLNSESYEQNLVMRYHCHAVMGLIRQWSEEDTKNIDKIAHAVSTIMSKEPLL